MGRTWADKSVPGRRELLEHMPPQKVECVISLYASGTPITEIMATCGIPLTGIIYDIVDAAGLPRRRGHYQKGKRLYGLTWKLLADTLTGKISLYEVYRKMLISGEDYKRIKRLREEIKDDEETARLIKLAACLLDEWFKPIEFKVKILEKMSVEELEALEVATAKLLFSVSRMYRRQFFKKFEHRKKIKVRVRRGRPSRKDREEDEAIKGKLVTVFVKMLEKKHNPAPYIWGALLGINPSALDRFLLDVVYPVFNAMVKKNNSNPSSGEKIEAVALVDA